MTTVVTGGVSLSLSAAEPAAAATPKPPTSQSVALAASMRRFDPALTAADVKAIAKAIDANDVAAQALNPKKKRLKNGDAPAVRFAVSDGRA